MDLASPAVSGTSVYANGLKSNSITIARVSLNHKRNGLPGRSLGIRTQKATMYIVLAASFEKRNLTLYFSIPACRSSFSPSLFLALSPLYAINLFFF